MIATVGRATLNDDLTWSSSDEDLELLLNEAYRPTGAPWEGVRGVAAAIRVGELMGVTPVYGGETQRMLATPSKGKVY